MLPALAGAAAAAVLSGTGQVLQAVAARRLPVGARLDLRLVGRMLRTPAYLLALLLTAAGFVLAVVALQRLPLFVVQSVRAANLVVAALLAVPVLGARLRAAEWAGIASVSAGLVLLAGSVGAQPAAAAAPKVGIGAVAAAVVLVATGWLVSVARPSRGGGLLLAGLAGSGFALLAVGARMVGPITGPGVLAHPLVWGAAAAGLCGLALQVLALNRAGVVAVTAVSVTTETVVSALLGVLLAGDHALAGHVPAAAAAFVLVLVGSSLVSRARVPELVPSVTPTPLVRDHR